MEVSTEVTKLGILNLNIRHENYLLTLSVPTKDNVVDLKDSVVFSLFENDEQISGGEKHVQEIINLFKPTPNGQAE